MGGAAAEGEGARAIRVAARAQAGLVRGVGVGQRLVVLEGADDAAPLGGVGLQVGRVGGAEAARPTVEPVVAQARQRLVVVRVEIADGQHVVALAALDHRIPARALAQAPVAGLVVDREAVLHGRRQAGRGLGRRRLSLQVAQRLVVQLADRVQPLVAAGHRPGAPELVEVVHHAAQALLRGQRVAHEHAGPGVPFGRLVGDLLEAAVLPARAGELHRHAQHAAVARVAAVQQVAEGGEAHPVGIGLDGADGFGMAAGIAEAEIAAPCALGAAADLHPRQVRRRAARPVGLVGAGRAALAGARAAHEQQVAATGDAQAAAGLHLAARHQRREPVELPAERAGREVAGRVVEIVAQHGPLQHGRAGGVDHPVAAGHRIAQHVDGRGGGPVEHVAAPLVGTGDAFAVLACVGAAPEVAVGHGVVVAAQRVPVTDVGGADVEGAAVGRAGGREFDRQVEHHVRLHARGAGEQRLGRQRHLGRARRRLGLRGAGQAHGTGDEEASKKAHRNSLLMDSRG